MIVKTKNYRLEKKSYIKLAMRNILKQQWWVGLIVIAICLGYVWIPSIWWFIGAFIGVGLYLLFWWIQFYGVTQLEQGKMLFERLSYEINSQQVLIKLSAREGMPMKWDQIKKAQIGKDYFLLMVNKAQLIYLPFKIFNSENERKFVTSILRTKGFIKQ
ncbi:MAG: YcxB family protein [Cyclobacteriaceae bacterium]|nr:YcxB family protein [Cyclobacteriaceae bacterium]